MVPAMARNKHHDTATTFGFREVQPEERQGLVNQVFATVADRYDLMNDLMSAGMHRLWKDELVSMLYPPKSEQRFDLIDVAGGTADIALRMLRKGGPGCRAVVCDISPEMLRVGRSKIEAEGQTHRPRR